MQQALGFSSKIVNFCGPFIYKAAPRAPWLQAFRRELHKRVGYARLIMDSMI